MPRRQSAYIDPQTLAQADQQGRYRALCAAVVQRALEDSHGRYGGVKSSGDHTRAEALRWLVGDGEGALPFGACCAAAGVSVHTVRRLTGSAEAA